MFHCLCVSSPSYLGRSLLPYLSPINTVQNCLFILKWFPSSLFTELSSFPFSVSLLSHFEPSDLFTNHPRTAASPFYE